MKKILLFSLLIFVFTACSNRPKEEYKKESEKVVRLGARGVTAFRNIPQNEAITIDNTGRFTRHGYGEITFNIDGKNETFAIFSVPAEDSNAVTYFRFFIEGSDERFPNFKLTNFDRTESNNNTSRNLEYSVRVGNSFVNVPAEITNRNGDFLVRIAGYFEEFRQENLIVIGIDSLLNSENSSFNVNAFINSMTNEDRLRSSHNTAYIVAYPWRTVRVLIEGGNSNTNARAVEWANENVFNQAIVRLELTSDSTNYEARIIATNSGDVGIYDEAGRIYQRFSSARPAFARVNTAEQRNFSYAVAFLLGVSLFEDERESNKTFHLNLMNRGEGDMSNRTHLSFRQWNQLHIRGREVK